MRNRVARVLGWLGKLVAFPILVALVAVFLWLPAVLIAVLPVGANLRVQVSWKLRKSFWDWIACLKFRLNKPISVPVPGRMRWWRWLLVGLFGKRLTNIPRVPFSEIFPGIPIADIQVAGHEPADEWDGPMKAFTWAQVTLYSLFPPMQPHVPAIDENPYQALGQAYTERHRRLFDPPVMPLEFQGSPDLGALAVKGPYACYLTKYLVGTNPADDAAWDFPSLQDHKDELYEWDFSLLRDFEHHEGVYKLGGRVLFQPDPDLGIVQPVRIRSEGRVYRPEDGPTWEFAKKLALCAATNHLSLVRHFNGVHLASTAHLAIATRNHLFPDHPLCRLLWPHVFRTTQSNWAVTLAQMAEGGDFDTVFSFTHKGMRDLFARGYRDYRFTVNHPKKDAEIRQIQNAQFTMPSQRDAEAMFELFRKHAREYLEIYYPTDPDIEGNPGINAWLKDLLDHIPGVGDVLDNKTTLDSVAELIAAFMYLTTVQHDIVGSFLWNYQLWAHVQPPRLYMSGKGLPLDVYQRLVNANYNLNVRRTPLIVDKTQPPGWEDFSYLALEEDGDDNQRERTKKAKQVFKNFQAALRNREAEWRGEQWFVWRVYPSLLEANINA